MGQQQGEKGQDEGGQHDQGADAQELQPMAVRTDLGVHLKAALQLGARACPCSPRLQHMQPSFLGSNCALLIARMPTC